jgi:hypothetical protein
VVVRLRFAMENAPSLDPRLFAHLSTEEIKKLFEQVLQSRQSPAQQVGNATPGKRVDNDSATSETSDQSDGKKDAVRARGEQSSVSERSGESMDDSANSGTSAQSDGQKDAVGAPEEQSSVSKKSGESMDTQPYFTCPPQIATDVKEGKLV